MNKRIYTPELREIIRQVYQHHSGIETCRIINANFGLQMTEVALRWVVSKYNLHKRGKYKGGPKARVYNDEQKAWLRRTYKKHDWRETCRRFNAKYGVNTNPSALRTWMNKNGIFAGGRDGKFDPGLTPWNAGTKGRTTRNSGSFKPGQMPPTLRPVGYERDPNREECVVVKVSDEWDPARGKYGIWKRKHHLVWEQHHGRPVPEDCVVIFDNGDLTDFRPENLSLLSRSEYLALRHQDYWEQPAEIKPALQTLTKLRMRIRVREKSKK